MFIIANNIIGDIVNKNDFKRKNRQLDTIIDERLIGNYKDEIDIEISEEFDLGMSPDALNTMSYHSHFDLYKMNREFNNKPIKKKPKGY